MGAGSSNGEWARTPPPNAHIVYKIGIYGWRKRCLYVFLLLLMVTVIVNLALTIWILKVLDFTVHGMGKLRIVEDGIRVEGTSEFIKPLYASHIRSSGNTGLSLESYRNLTLNARDKDRNVRNRLYLGEGKIASYANSFEVRDAVGRMLFYADNQRVLLGADKLSVPGEGGATFQSSIQTPLVRPDVSSDLRLESPTRSLRVSGPKGVSLKAPVGAISINSLDELKLESTRKAIKLESPDIQIKNLPMSRAEFAGRLYPEVYQLCICGNSNKLFLSPAQANCQASPAICD